jgi:hypothetical protein
MTDLSKFSKGGRLVNLSEIMKYFSLVEAGLNFSKGELNPPRDVRSLPIAESCAPRVQVKSESQGSTL